MREPVDPARRRAARLAPALVLTPLWWALLSGWGALGYTIGVLLVMAAVTHYDARTARKNDQEETRHVRDHD